MNRIDITVMTPQAALEAFAAAWRRTEAGETAMTPQLAFGSLRDLFSALTEKRLELLRYIATHEGLNIRQVAQAVGRNYKNVYTDVKDLVKLGLLERNEQDHLSAPFDEIVIHAGLRDTA